MAISATSTAYWSSCVYKKKPADWRVSTVSRACAETWEIA